MLPARTDAPTISDDLKDEVEWKKGTKKKGPTLKFKKNLTSELAEKAKALYPGNEEVAKTIDEALNKQSEADAESDGENTDDATAGNKEDNDK